MGRFRQAFWERGKDARASFDQGHSQVTLVEYLQPVMLEGASGVVKFRREFHARRAAAHDCNVDKCMVLRFRHCAGDPQALVEQLEPKSIRLLTIFQKKAMLLDARRAEIVGDGADRDGQIIIAYAVAPDYLGAVVDDGGDDHLPGIPVDGFQISVEIAVFPAVSVAAVAHLIEIGIKGSGGDLMEQRLPNVGPVSLDKDDVEPGATELCA